MKLKFLIPVLMVFFISCKQTSKEIVNITVSDLKTELAENNIQLLDVRTPEEWEQGTIDGALKVNYYDDNFVSDATSQLSKDKPVYVYCKSGGRSLQASEKLLNEGYKVYNVLGGYNHWKEENSK
ncbi:rhodanese-like domain-containing protein [Tenacibaculum sp. IB213877]|uniref:rhodanese-like domain-containing protein n=1 Tax=Tenacibaculum sp. IB213877 TaxID=3097351 RepID=UPI002A5A6364|nr:rhodanese-like domain-containing protein [Tenacibaculum sp. IB213877]MDY0780841.1 rhodanese-like domain-containing protein [Tenacibaculum sp. IB213877]